MDDEAEAIVAQGQALVLQNPSVAALDWPPFLAQPRSMGPTALVKARVNAEGSAQIPMRFGIIALVGEHGPDPGQDRKGPQEQPFEQEGVVDIGGGHRASHRHPARQHGTWCRTCRDRSDWGR